MGLEISGTITLPNASWLSMTVIGLTSRIKLYILSNVTVMGKRTLKIHANESLSYLLGGLETDITFYYPVKISLPTWYESSAASYRVISFKISESKLRKSEMEKEQA